MNEFNRHRAMIAQVANALGPEFLEEMVFLGGCTTGLLLTDDFSRESVRHTNDVDLIVRVVGKIGWFDLQRKLRALGFREDMDEDGPICAMRYGELRVDFMPDDEAILGFSNRWYAAALGSADPYQIDDTTSIRLVSPVYFVATKLEAYLGRGNGDVLASHDIEDILVLFDGRDSIVEEITQSEDELRAYIAEQITGLLQDPGLGYAIQSTAGGNDGRARLILERLEHATKAGA